MLVRYPGYDAVGRALAGHFALANLRLGFEGSQTPRVMVLPPGGGWGNHGNPRGWIRMYQNLTKIRGTQHQTKGGTDCMGTLALQYFAYLNQYTN